MGRAPKVIVMSHKQRPHEIMLFVLAPIFTYQLIFGTPSDNVLSLPHWEVVTFASTLFISGFGGLLGCVLRALRRWYHVGLLLETGALMLGAGGLFFFLPPLIRTTHWHGVGWLFTAVWLIANVWRAVQCINDIGALRKR